MVEPVQQATGGTPESDSSPPSPGVPSAAAGDEEAAAGWQVVDLLMQVQGQTNWCWAAVAASVAHFYDNGTDVTQCAVADGELGFCDCCDAGGPGHCNVYGLLGSSLNRVRHLRKIASGKTAAQDQLRAEIGGRAPLCLRVAYFAGGAHFAAIVGYLPGSESPTGSMLVAVADSRWGDSDLPYEDLLTDYQSGRWTDTYYVQPKN